MTTPNRVLPVLAVAFMLLLGCSHPADTTGSDPAPPDDLDHELGPVEARRPSPSTSHTHSWITDETFPQESDQVSTDGQIDTAGPLKPCQDYAYACDEAGQPQVSACEILESGGWVGMLPETLQGFTDACTPPPPATSPPPPTTAVPPAPAPTTTVPKDWVA